MNKRNSKKKLNKKYLKLLYVLLILVVFFVGLSLIRYYNIYTKTKEFKSTSGKISFLYPKDFPIVEKTGEDLIREYNYSLLGDWQGFEWIQFRKIFVPRYFQDVQYDNLAEIYVEKSEKAGQPYHEGYQSLSEYKESLLKHYKEEFEGFGKFGPPEFTNIKIAGQEALHVKFGNGFSGCHAIPTDGYVFFYKEYVHTLCFNEVAKKSSLSTEKYEAAKKTILATFKINKKAYDSVNVALKPSPIFEDPYAENLDLLKKLINQSLPIGWVISSYSSDNHQIILKKTINNVPFTISFWLWSGDRQKGEAWWSSSGSSVIDVIKTKKGTEMFILKKNPNVFASTCLPLKQKYPSDPGAGGCSILFGKPSQFLHIMLDVPHESDGGYDTQRSYLNDQVINEFKQVIESLDI